MKVKDLIEKLKHCNPDAVVIQHNCDEEVDTTVDYIEEFDILTEDDLKYTINESYAADYIGKPVVYLL